MNCPLPLRPISAAHPIQPSGEMGSKENRAVVKLHCLKTASFEAECHHWIGQ